MLFKYNNWFRRNNISRSVITLRVIIVLFSDYDSQRTGRSCLSTTTEIRLRVVFACRRRSQGKVVCMRHGCCKCCHAPLSKYYFVQRCLLVSRPCDDVLVVRGDVAAQHRRRLLRLKKNGNTRSHVHWHIEATSTVNEVPFCPLSSNNSHQRYVSAKIFTEEKILNISHC